MANERVSSVEIVHRVSSLNSFMSIAAKRGVHIESSDGILGLCESVSELSDANGKMLLTFKGTTEKKFSLSFYWENYRLCGEFGLIGLSSADTIAKTGFRSRFKGANAKIESITITEETIGINTMDSNNSPTELQVIFKNRQPFFKVYTSILQIITPF